ncbi:MAG: hypothetical protein Q7K57_29320 [Burkholderiaceae bacterium]|nr:hypothetical protein [Burkholderiaceae bacterium]
MLLTIFLYYMGIGLIVLVSLSAHGKWKGRNDGPDPFARRQTTSWQMRVANIYLVPLAIVLLFIPAWPWILSVEFNFPRRRFKFWSDKAAADGARHWPDPEPEFEVSEADLLEKLSQADIEDNERVDDPLHAVPDQPFGHLYKVWQAFIDGLEPGCELWSFQGRWKTAYRDNQMQGYVARRGEKIGPYFLTSQSTVDPGFKTVV